MDITVVEAPRTTAFTTLGRMHRELNLRDDSKDARLTDLIEEVSADIVAYCHQPLIRQSVTERQVGRGRTVQMMSVTPVPRGGVRAVRFGFGSEPRATVSGYYVSNPDAGFIQFYSNDRFRDTRPYDRWIEVDPAIMPGDPAYEFDYTGGYILPGDDVTTSGGRCIANALDNSFELVGGVSTFPIVTSGETIIVSGYDHSENNGRFTVLDRTLSKLYVDSSLVTESGTNVISVQCRNLPRDIESAAVLEVKYRYLTQFRDPTIRSESLGDWSADYGTRGNTGDDIAEGLLPQVARRLEKYIRLE
jgi:hypothetical protein